MCYVFNNCPVLNFVIIIVVDPDIEKPVCFEPEGLMYVKKETYCPLAYSFHLFYLLNISYPKKSDTTYGFHSSHTVFFLHIHNVYSCTLLIIKKEYF